MNDVTSQLADYVVNASLSDIPDDVRKESRRALHNYVGCALGGSHHEAMDIVLAALGPYSGERNARVLGRADKVDPLLASMLNGISSHVHDYDDTTPKNFIHPTSPVASALFGYAAVNPVSGADFELALILGIEVVSRIGTATYPSHYDAGWHSTGSIGVFGAAATIGKLLKLPTPRMVGALGLAGTQSAGLREMFGAMAKSFHPGRSAQSGYMAALLAQSGFTAGDRVLEGPRGFAAVQAPGSDLSIITDGLGVDFGLRSNTYKPYPCGIVVHPIIDACSQLRVEHSVDPRNIAAVRLRVAPIVKDLCDKRNVATGLEGKFSAYHGAAVGLARGKGGLAEFTDAAACDPFLRQLRSRIESIADESITPDGVSVEVDMISGEKYRKTIEHSIGNLKHPLSNAQLDEKFREQADRIPSSQADALIAACWNIEEINDVSRLIALAVPTPA